jgi:hypothetical protein
METEIQKQLTMRSAEGWRPEPGEKVSGTIAHISAAQSEYGTYPVITIAAETDDPETVRFVAVHAFHHTLKRDLIAIRPEVGQRLSVVYVGEQETGREIDGKPVTYQLYTVTAENMDKLWASF